MRVKLLKKLRKKMLNKYRMVVWYHAGKPSTFRIYEVRKNGSLWSIEECKSKKEAESSTRKFVRDKILDYVHDLRYKPMSARRIKYLW